MNSIVCPQAGSERFAEGAKMGELACRSVFDNSQPCSDCFSSNSILIKLNSNSNSILCISCF